ncbi:hypothetical protein EDD11_008659 [Mortierella claussenii]|nr:hypothetical protein EDD11_008659 [Mortierella claussenii]
MNGASSSTTSQPLPPSLPRNGQTGITIVAASRTTFEKPAGKASKGRFLQQDIESILTWLEHPPNFASIFGCGGQRKPRRTSSKGYATLAQIVNKQNKGRLNLNGKAVRERFGRYMKSYMDIKKKAQSTGFGVTDEDRMGGIYTVAQKLESLFSYYARMDALFGHRPNVTSVSRKPVQEREQAVQEDLESHRRNISSHRRCRLIADEEDDADYEADQDVQDMGNLKIVNNCTPDDLDESGLIDDSFDGSFDNSLNGIGDDSEEELAMGTNNDKTSELSLSLSPVLQRRQKRQLRDTESRPQIPKRSRTKDRHEKQPSPDLSSSPELSRRPFQSSYELADTKKAAERRKLELEEKKFAVSGTREMRRLELEERNSTINETIESKKLELEERKWMRELEMMARRLEWEKAHEAEKIEWEKAREARQYELEQKKLDQESHRWKTKMETKVSIHALEVIKAGLEKGLSVEQIQALVKNFAPRAL